MRKVYALLLTLLFINTSIVVLSVENETFQSAGEKPEWDQGDTWIYDMDLTISLQSDTADISVGLSLNRLECVVSSILNVYTVRMSSQISGSFSIDVEGAPKISGSLQNTNMDGTVKIGVDSLSFEEFEMNIDGKVKVNFIPITIDLHLIASSAEPVTFLEFPLEVGKSWNTNESLISLQGEIDLPGIANLIPDIPDEFVFDNDLIVGGQTYECILLENRSTRAGIFPSYTITYGEGSQLFFSTVAGNILSVIPSGEMFGDMDIDVGFTLISTSYVMPGAPNKPERPIGPTKGKPGEKQTFTAKAVDPEGDQIYYSFDWGDGTLSSWMGPFSSDEAITVNWSWSEKGSYAVRVKAKDVYGHESVWSDPLVVQMPRNALFSWYVNLFLEKYPVIYDLIMMLTNNRFR